MNDDKIKEVAKLTAKITEIQMRAFQDAGFTRAEAVTFCAAIMGSPNIYVPFSGVMQDPSKLH